MKKRIFLFGTGKISKKYTNILENLSVKIFGYIDNDENKWGSLFFGREIQSPNKLKEEPDAIIVIACADVESIKAQLYRVGLQERIVSLDCLVRKALEKSDIEMKYIRDPYVEEDESREIIIDNLDGSWGGAEDWAHKITVSLAARGYRAVIVEDQAIETGKEFEPITKHIDKKSKKTYEIYTELIEWLSQKRPFTLFNIWNSELLWAASYIKKRYPEDVQIISAVLNDTYNFYEHQYEWKDYIDACLCISSKIRNTLVREYGMKEEKVYYRAPFIEGERTIEKTYHMDENTPLMIGYPCRLVQNQKRADLLPQLISELEKRRINYIVNIAGDGPCEEEIMKYAENSRLNSKIKFYGKLTRKELMDFLEMQDIYLNFSEYEGTSLTMLEAMRSGCVPVVTNVSGVNDFVKHMENGMVSDIGDLEDLADHIFFLDRNREKLSSYGKKCRDIVSLRCNQNDYIDYIEQLIKS